MAMYRYPGEGTEVTVTFDRKSLNKPQAWLTLLALQQVGGI